MQDLYGIMVVYNKLVDDSITYQCLKEAANIYVVVCDNSNKPFSNRETVEQDGYIYIDMEGNCGLSKAYNRALDAISVRNPSMDGYVMIFDDDTFLPADFFEKMSEAIASSRADIYLPIVEDEIGILSPNVMKKYYCHRVIADVWSIKKEELCGINSGMTIRLALFQRYRYDEGLFLDYVDHNFLRDMRKDQRKLAIVDTKIRQTFSSNTDSKEKATVRFQIFKKDINHFYAHGFWNRFFFYYVITRRKIELARKYRDLRFIFR